MEVFAISKYINGIPKEIIFQELANNSGVVLVDYTMSSINVTNSYLNIIQDYLEASFIAEELGKYSKSVKVKEISRYPYSPDCRYEFVVGDADSFVQRLNELSLVYSGEPDEGTLERYQDDISSYEKSLDERVFLCPELMDGYYVNLVEAAYIELGSELGKDFLKSEYKKYPERKFGFWKSAYSKTIGQTIYISRESWVIPEKSDIQKFLTEYLGFSEFEVYDEAFQLNLDGENFLISKYAVDHLPVESISRTQRFIRFFLSKQKAYGLDLQKLYSKPKYLLSRSGYSMMIEDGLFTYLFFPESVKENKILDLYTEMSTVFGVLADFSGVNKDIKLPWDNFDDEKFENLCYDIIYHSPQYDGNTIRKMGKSRSRDGGRDITVYTNERPGNPKKLYIFQCKFTKVGTSLTTQKVVNISDTVAQYGGQGYGVMTPVVIDSALYDRIDEICRRSSMESHNWSTLEIERFIARHPKLRERHFGY